MSRIAFFVVAMLAMLLGATAQMSSSSSSGMELDSSSSSAEAFSSSIVVELSSSSTFGDVPSSSSGMEVMSSSGEPVMSSSSGEAMMSSSTGGATVPPFVPVNWEQMSFLPDGATINVTWGAKSSDNLMFNVGTTNGFIVNGVSGGAVRLGLGHTYNITIDSIAAPFGFYIDVDPMGDKTNGNVTQPILAAGSYAFTINSTNINDQQSQTVFLYYASNSVSYAGGAAILGHQSAAALQASIMVMVISAFFALMFPKW